MGGGGGGGGGATCDGAIVEFAFVFGIWDFGATVTF
jgi:hypothetical protein